MIGICVPAHNEARSIAACLRSLQRAAQSPALLGEPVQIVVVLDACTDRTGIIAERFPVTRLTIDARNVGAARALGASHLLHTGARWLAFTDADTRVDADWLAEQLALNADVVCGTVGAHGWAAHGEHAAQAREGFLAAYRDEDGHRHVHGANLGIAADAYRRAGGFTAMTCSEDQALVDRLEHLGAHIAWSAQPRVSTSARPFSRVDGGFATTLRRAWERVETGGELAIDMAPLPLA